MRQRWKKRELLEGWREREKTSNKGRGRKNKWSRGGGRGGRQGEIGKCRNKRRGKERE